MQVLLGKTHASAFSSSVAVPVTIYVCHYMKQSSILNGKHHSFSGTIFPSYLLSKGKKKILPAYSVCQEILQD